MEWCDVWFTQPLHVEHEGEEVTAAIPSLDRTGFILFGSGATEVLAKEDLREILIEIAEMWNEQEHGLLPVPSADDDHEEDRAVL